MNDARPLAVFDSGVGGISVLKELVRLMPEENYLYYGDSANAPYGSKSVDAVRRLSVDAVERLLAMGAKAVVIACNTATSVAAEALREKHHDVPIIGVEPALKPAVLFKAHPAVAVLATPLTLKEKKFRLLMESFSHEADILPVPCDRLAALIEKGCLEGETLSDYLKSVFAPYKGKRLDAVVLGCTHYPFVRRAIQEVVGESVRLFDGGEGTARETKRRLMETESLKTDGAHGKVRFFSSRESEEELAFYERLFQSDI